jgi:molybdopterin molybdotransferase
MLTVSEAQAIVLRHTRPLAPRPAQLTPAALGLVLAEDVASDLDMPPFDKSMMDGYAVRSADIVGGPATLDVIEEITAGRTPSKTLGPGQAARIMTGAPLPAGADAVVMIERCESIDDAHVRVPGPADAGQNIQPRARELQRGATVLMAGAVLRPPEFGLLAMVGRTEVSVYPLPRVAVLATGDEIVEPSAIPRASQIRNSNGPMLLAQAASAGAVPIDLGIARDTVEHLRAKITEGLQSDVLLLSGGVSAGKLDLVPGVLQQQGVEAHFHKVRMKPGKPVFFGTKGETLVFGLPGNPVSSFACFELFVRPAILRRRGLPAAPPTFVPLPLAEDFRYATDRPTYHPAKVELAEVGERIRPVTWLGSPDLRALASADALVLLPEGDHVHRAGKLLPVLRLAYK